MRLLESLEAVAEEHPLDRKLLVGPTLGAGRELLRALALRRGRWIGFEPTTLRPLALEIVGSELAAEGLELLDDFSERALIDRALDEVLEEWEAPRFQPLAEGVGFRDAVAGAVGTFRLGGITPARLRKAGLADREKAEILAAVLRRFEDLLESGARMDTAGVITRAAITLEQDGSRLPGGRHFLLPGLGLRGESGRLVRALLEAGARLLSTDPVHGSSAPRGVLWATEGAGSLLSRLDSGPSGDVGGDAEDGEDPSSVMAPVDISLFHAGSLADELRELLRRVMASGRRWDEVEVVTPDPAAYGSVLHALSRELNIPVSFGVGLPVERTRAGRAVATYFRWLEEDFAAEILHAALEAEDLRPTADDVDGLSVARRLRTLRIGWGRGRYLPALDRARLRASDDVGPRPGEDPEQWEARSEQRDRALREIEVLRGMVEPVLDAVPPVPFRTGRGAPPVSPADLARGLRAFLEWVPVRAETDRTALERIDRVLDRVEAELTRPASFAAAAAILREHLEIRVPAPEEGGSAPWSSSGGRLHLTDLAHGGYTGRPLTFVVGLDAGRFPGAGLQDPLLLDGDRQRLDAAALPTSADRIEERRFDLRALLARLRGRVHLSYAAWDAAEGRTATPAPVLLQAYRLATGDPRAGFGHLREHLGDPASPVPTEAATDEDGLLDLHDVWLASLRRDGRLLEGRERIREAFPALDRGIQAREERLEGAPGPLHGLVEPRPELDPRRTGDAVSATQLETLGTCGRRYFFRYVLQLRPPEVPELDPEAWLTPMDRGQLLHAVFQRALERARAEEVSLEELAFEALALEVLDAEAETMRRRVPPPSEAVHRREMEDLVEDIRSWVGYVREDLEGARWSEVEVSFGFRGEDPVTMDLPGGPLRTLGRIDRIDVIAGERLRVVDYKTGRFWGHSAREGPFRGGRRFQHVLYAEAARVLSDSGLPVGSVEYHFPTVRGRNERAFYSLMDLAGGTDLLDRLLDGAARGRFLPTDHADDCTYCDYRSVCRVEVDRWGRPSSPAADWGRERIESEEAYEAYRAVRGLEAEEEG